MVDNKKSVNWEAKEYIQREKGVNWYLGLIGVSAVFVIISVLFQWFTFAALVVLCAISLMIYSSRPPKMIKYTLSGKGLMEGEKFYGYEDYKSFGVLKDEGNFAIVLVPRKRFSTVVTIYFPEEKGEEIVDMFGARLPMEEVKLDFLDKLVRMLHI